MKESSHYNKKHKQLARNLRKNSTPAEESLWTEVLRGKQFYGYQFNRQFPIDEFIVDFICRKLRLVIEVDGYSHNFKVTKGKERDKRIEELSYITIRVIESEVKKDLRNVVRVLESYLPDEKQ